MLTQRRLAELVNYCAERGEFVAIKSRGNIKAGMVLGKPRVDGYVRIGIDGKDYFAHRLAFLWVHGFMPDVVDHINGDRSDNRIANLRAASVMTNNRNSAKKSYGKSRFRGVSARRGGKWRACIRIDGKKHLYLIECRSEIEAAYWYDMASIEHHGDRGRRNFLPLC